jgi:hypothetical protein
MEDKNERPVSNETENAGVQGLRENDPTENAGVQGLRENDPTNRRIKGF